MIQSANFIAADLGASGGRLMLGKWDGRAFFVEELHRFANGGVQAGDGLYWDILSILSHIRQGLQKYRSADNQAPHGIAVDAWGVDFGLIDRAGRLIGNPRHYRDPRTGGVPERVFKQVAESEWFAETGVQTMAINTLFQVSSMLQTSDPALEWAETLLMIPDLCGYLLCGEKFGEWSEATTTQMYSLRLKDWARDLLEKLSLPVAILPQVVRPGTVLSPILSNVKRDCGFTKPFPVIAVGSHDTASAVAAIPNMGENSVFLSSGTWSLMGVESKEADTSDRAFQLGFTNEGSASGDILLMKNLTGLWILQECLRQWKSQGLQYNWSEIVAAAENARPLSCFIDPDAAPFRMPCDMPQAIRQYCHDTDQNIPESAGEVARCIFQSLSLKYRAVLELLRELTGRRLTTIHVVGGGGLNYLLCQMTADACGCQVVTGPVEASTLGNVMLQAVATGHLSDVASGRIAIAQSVQLSIFHPKNFDKWDEAYARFRTLEAGFAYRSMGS